MLPLEFGHWLAANKGAAQGGMSFRAQRGISLCGEVDRSSRWTRGLGGRKNQSEIPRCARNDNGRADTRMASLLIKGGHVISPEDQWDGELDVLVEDGTIRRIAPQISEVADELVEAAGKVVSPGFVDIHVHLREPGGESPRLWRRDWQPRWPEALPPSVLCPIPSRSSTARSLCAP